MKKRSCGWRHCLIAFASIAASTHLFAQSQNEISVDALLKQARSTFNLIDSRNMDAIWENASPVMHSTLKKADFAARVDADRADLGPIEKRTWRAISRADYASGNTEQVPPGNYINMIFLASDKGGSLIQESISFRLEENTQWRMTGYVSQKVTAK